MGSTVTTFHEIYTRHAQDVYRFAFWLTGDSDEAKDITSETFVRVWTSTSDLKVETVKAYLFSIARNVHLRARQRRRNRETLSDGMADPHDRPDHTAGVRLELDRTMKAMQMLSEQDRSMLLMHAGEHLPYEDIARLTGLSIAAIKVRIFRARARLVTLLDDETGDTPCPSRKKSSST